MHKLDMNRSFRNSVNGGGMNFPLSSHHRRGLSLNGASNGEAFDDSLDLFSKSRRSFSAASSEDSEVSAKLGRLAVGSVAVGKNGSDDLLSASEEGKHDYDWLLTPPGTPLPSSNGKESQPAHVAPAPRSRPLARSVSASKPSRLSVSQSENTSQPTRAARSRSVTRPSISTSQFNTYSNKSSNSILNTSSASVSSYIRQPTPTRSSSSTRPSRPSLSRPSTPPRGSSSRPSTPSSKPSPASRQTTSRPSTPTRRNSFPSASPTPTPGRTVSNGRNVGGGSRPSSPARTPVSRPSSPIRRAPQPIVLPDFSLETPSNLRTSLPDRPLSAGRSRPDPARAPHGSKLPQRKPTRTAASESVGFGGTISKKSLDVAIRHMDIRNGRAISGSTLFPPSIRSNGSKKNPSSSSGSMNSSNRSEEEERHIARVTDGDVYESCRYDMLLLKEDVKNTNWLHSFDDNKSEAAMFDHGFEPLPEPFDPLLR